MNMSAAAGARRKKVQSSLEYLFNALSTTRAAGTNTKPTVVRICPRKRSMGRPQKSPENLPAAACIVDYSAIGREESSPQLKNNCIHRMYSQS